MSRVTVDVANGPHDYTTDGPTVVVTLVAGLDATSGPVSLADARRLRDQLDALLGRLENETDE